MKFRDIFVFELGIHLRRTSTWLYFAIMAGMIYRIATEGYIGIARNGGFLYNGPFVVASLIMTASLLGLLVAAAIAGDAGARDIHTRMHPLFYSAPVSKRAYLGGRVLAAYVLNVLLMLAAPIALLLASLSSAIEPELLGAFRPATYILAFLCIAVPNAFVATALMFSLAALTRRAMAAYIGSILLFTVTILSSEFIARQLGMWDVARLVDPIGLIALTEISKSWTPAEKSSVLIGLQPGLLLNRALWVGIAMGILAFAHARFRFAHPVGGASWRRRTLLADRMDSNGIGTAAIVVPRVQPTFRKAARAHQATTVAIESLRLIVGGWGGLIVGGMTVFLIFLVPSLMEHMRVPLIPTTEHMTAIFTSDDLLWLFIPLLIVFYAGELVWREREAGLCDIADAAPIPEWVVIVGKFAGLVLALISLQIVMMGAAILIQTMFGYHDYELALYAKVLFGLKLIDYLLFAMLALTVHVLVNHKYAGHMIAFGIYTLAAFAPTFGIESNLIVFGSDPGWDYSDLRGFGPGLAPYIWFKLYWAAWAILLAVATRLLWVRGREQGLRMRMAAARRRFTARTLVATVCGLLSIIGLGGFVFYNTNLLNVPETEAESTARRAEYERRYGELEDRRQPSLTATWLNVEILPKQRKVEIEGRYQLVNRSALPIDTIYVATDRDVTTSALKFDARATRSLADERLGHHVYVLDRPLCPGDALSLSFAVTFHPRGFTNSGADASIAPNASYFELNDWLPKIGYQPNRELVAAPARKTHGLPLRAPVRALQDGAKPGDAAERIAFEAVVSTDAEAIALAPGRLLRTWSENGRTHYHYRTDAPISNDYAIFAAKYAVRRERWKDVDIEIYHHPAHDNNLDRMVRSMRASLDYMGAHYGAYPHGQIRLVERPAEGNSLHAFPINISFEEGFSLFNPEKDERDIDLPFGVVAHEVAHQWWGHVVTPADVEGAPLLSESLAWFSALAIVEKAYGRAHMERLVSMLREANLSPRARADVPLLQAHDWFTAYRKGPFAMYALREYVSDERINVALQRMVAKYGSGQAPLPTSLDLYRELQTVTPDSLRYLLTDLFEVNTFWELETKAIRAEQAGADTWRVTLDVAARKIAVDTAGAETVLPMNDLVEVGVFAAAEKGKRGKPIYLGLHRIRAGEQRITVTVRGRPDRAGIDPRNLLIDAEPENNVRQVPQKVPEPAS